jgi:hypothetical protein
MEHGGVARTTRWPDRLALLALLLVAADAALSALLGAWVAIRWPSLREAGEGFGGGWQLPLLGFLVALLLGLAGLSVADPGSAGAARPRRWLAVAGPFLILVGFGFGAHLLDPCARGWLDAGSRLGSAPTCERFGEGLGIHTRFHLLWHALVPTALLVSLYWAALRRWHPAATRFA